MQLKDCKEVNINAENNQGDKVTNIDEQSLNDQVNFDTNMLTIIFDADNSANSKNATELAVNVLNAVKVKSIVWVTIPNSIVLEKINALIILNKYIHRRKSTKAFFRNRPIDLYQFVRTLQEIRTCGLNHYIDSEDRACWKYNDNEGWGCKYISSIQRKLTEKPSTQAQPYWYNFGNFDKNGIWKINKALIATTIMQEVNSKGIDLCCHFNPERIIKAIQSLPDKIKIDSVNFTNSYRKEFNGETLVLVPDNIKHICIMTDDQKRESLIKERIKKLEYMIGMGDLKADEERRAKDQLLVLTGAKDKYSREFFMQLYPEKGFRYSDS